jgi:enoyl-CoA hydratase
MDKPITNMNALIDGSVGIIEIARPDVFNALSMEIFRDISSALREFENDKAVHSVLIRSQGKNFCTGADLSEVRTSLVSPERVDRFLSDGHQVLIELERSTLPVVVAVQGLALAGGMELLLAGDVVFAARGAKFGDQHGQFGLVPGWGGSQRLPRIVGLRRSMDMFLGVRWIDAETALAWGLVNYVVDDAQLNESALAYCQKLASRSRDGLAAMKRLARRGQDLDLKAALEFEVEEASRVLLGRDVAEGLSAFEERRAPQFS